MKITTVSYEELVSSRDDYGNKKIGAVAIVGDGETPEDVFTNLAYWVKNQFLKIGMQPPELRDIEYKIESRKQYLVRLEDDVEKARKKWKLASDFLEKHGVIIDEFDIPF